MPGEGSGTPLQYSCLENPWMEEPGRLQFMGSLRVGRARATSLSLFTFMHWRRKWQPTPVFLPGESQDSGAWWAAISGVAQSRTRLRRLSSSSSSIMPVMMISSFIMLWESAPKQFEGETGNISSRVCHVSKMQLKVLENHPQTFRHSNLPYYSITT